MSEPPIDAASTPQRRGGRRLGEMLVAQGAITSEQLETALGRKIRPVVAPESEIVSAIEAFYELSTQRASSPSPP